ncbi:Lsr2 family protein [Microbacterium sp. P06]|uniref:histone-like nucleoid-structuring protein Lsr2 n=1 Tax=unclassified Microbacterium TaxID=2609290 RepID=UPI003746D7FB
MARKQITQIIDDLDGKTLDEGGETVLFSLDGRPYEIDLSSAHAEELREALKPFIEAGRSVGASARTVTSRSRATRRQDGRDLSAVRAWARENGHTISERGRVPAAILEAYDAGQ